MNYRTLCEAAMRRRMTKSAAAILTPEAEQAAVSPDAGMAPQGGAPMPQEGGMPAPGGAPMPPEAGGAPAGGGGLPPEIMQDQGFIEWLAQQGVQLDPNSGQFIDGQSGQPLPPDVVMQAYQAYQAEMQGGAPAGGAPMPPEAGGAPMPPEAGAPMPPEAGAPMPPEGGAPAGGDPASDQLFIQFMQEAMGVQFDPNSGQFMDPQSGQPVPPDMVMQAYGQFQQQMAQAQGAPQEGGAPQGGAPDMTQMMDQLQSMVDAVVDSRVSPLMKKLEALDEKLEKLTMMLDAKEDTDDQRAKEDIEESRKLRDEIAADLNPTEKTASAAPAVPVMDAVKPSVPAPQPIAMFDIIAGGVR